MKMKLTAQCLMVMLLCGYRAPGEAGNASAPTKPDNTTTTPKTHLVRVMDFEDSGHHLLIWSIAFQALDGQKVRCQLPYGTGFVTFAGLENLKPYELDQRTDFSSLPWFKITIQEGKTVGLRQRPQYRLVGWEKAETKSAEPPPAN